MKTILLLCLTLALAAEAHMVRPKGTLSLMTDVNRDSTQFDTIYSFQYYWGVGLRYYRLELEDGSEYKSYIPLTSFLLKRWNNEDSQGNIYAYGGVGQTDYSGGAQDFSETSRLYGLQADWETTKIYFMAKHESIKNSRETLREEYLVRAGFSAYEASYYEMWTWYMLQVEQDRAQTDQITVTPLMRFFYKNILWEIGAPHRGGFIFSLMVDY